MAEPKDNVVRVDFKTKRYVDDDRPVEPEVVPEPEQAEENAEAAPDSEKFERFTSMIEDGLVLLTFDTRTDGVSVPEQFAGTPQLHLSFSFAFHIDDFEFDEKGLRATLSFGSGDHTCQIPWESVYGMQSRERKERVVFPDSFPTELLALLPSLSEDSSGGSEEE
ncbi:MAG: stringent starvation protein B [Bradymonadia bacterium]|jgi:stringent starvation protein B